MNYRHDIQLVIDRLKRRLRQPSEKNIIQDEILKSDVELLVELWNQYQQTDN